MNVARRAPGNVRADAIVHHRLHKTPVVVEEDTRAEISFPPATAVITSRRGTREHPDQDNGRSRECRDLAEDPESLHKDHIHCRRISLGGGGVGAARIVAHLLASKRKLGRETLHHLFRATNGEFAG